MTEIDTGVRDERGEWQPRVITPGPLFDWPPRPRAILKWLFGYPGYFFPWPIIVAAIPILTWFFLTPDLSTMKTFKPGWIALIYLRNVALLMIVAGGFHLRFYVQKAQGFKYKYKARWLEKNNSRFLFNNQTWDNMFWSIISGCGVWTAYEVMTYWAYANGHIPYLEWMAHPVYFVLLYLAIHPIHELHFYLGHRLLHMKPLYKAAHHVHHKNVNIGPWSGLSMHTIEHIVYFSCVFLYWILLAHPVHAIYHLQFAGLMAPLGHTGFENLVVKGDSKIPASSDYFHYLHHRYFECNYGGNGITLDKWFGTFHDGSSESHAAMRAKRQKVHG